MGREKSDSVGSSESPRTIGTRCSRRSAPSTHILKVYDPRFSHAPCNEAFVGSLAARLGLSIASTIPTAPCLLIERYDRTRENVISVRLHQEDAAQAGCMVSARSSATPPVRTWSRAGSVASDQALGVHAFRKYQREGGVGIAQVLDLIRHHSSTPLQDQQGLITWQLANLILGNADGHLKNISFLYDGASVSPAPAASASSIQTFRQTIERNDMHFVEAFGKMTAWVLRCAVYLRGHPRPE
jgi:serine/threonine-protein kinase HipA